MQYSLILLSGAAIALAGPIIQKREVDVVVETVVETVVDYYTVTQSVTTDAAAATSTPVETPVVTVTVAPTTTPQAAKAAAEVQVTTSSSAAAEVQSTSSSSSAAAASPTSFADIAVYQHNIHRANHSAPDVTYGDTYAGYAATVAASCKFAHDLSEGDGNYGQNIAMYASSDSDALDENTALAQAITSMWYDAELELYPGPYGSEPDMTNFEAWGHFSQVVWNGTQIVGCAVQKCAPGTMESDMTAWFTVCNYYPAGKMGTLRFCLYCM